MSESEPSKTPPPLPPASPPAEAPTRPPDPERARRIATTPSLRWLHDAKSIFFGDPGRRRVDKKRVALVVLMLGLIQFFAQATVAFVHEVFRAYDHVVQSSQKSDSEWRKEELEERRRENAEVTKRIDKQTAAVEKQAESLDDLTEAIRESLWAQGKALKPPKRKPRPAQPATGAAP